MDGVSVLFGALSFSLQLVDTIHKVRKFLNEVQNAPKELARLNDTLGQYADLMIAADDLATQQKQIGGQPGSLSIIEGALQRCRSTVERLHASVKIAQSHFRSQRGARKAWASFKTAMRREEVEELHDRVLQDIQSLQTALIINNSFIG